MHSILISNTAHRYADKIINQKYGVYRIFYVVFSLITLLPLLWYQFSLYQQILFERTLFITAVQLILIIYSLLMFHLGSKVYDMQYFLGITQWKNAQKKVQPIQLPFHSDGVLSYVRHPWYSAGITFIWGVGDITDVYLVTRIILTGYFLIGTYLEEKRLLKEIGKQYAFYCRNVPMLFPWKLKKHSSSSLS